MKKQFIMVIALLALVSMMIVPVCAETLTGTLGGTSVSQSITTIPAGAGSPGNAKLTVYNISRLVSPTALIRFDLPGTTSTYTNATVISNSTWFVMTDLVSGKYLGSGSAFFQRHWNTASPPVEVEGYQVLTFNDYSPSNATNNVYGGTYLMSYGYSEWFGRESGVAGGAGTVPGSATNPVWAFFGNSANAKGIYQINTGSSASADYTATKPGGVGISGSITKTSGLSIAHVFNGATGASITGEPSASLLPFNFSVFEGSIILSIFDGTTRYNSSILFAPTVTPTPTPTPGPTIPPGYVRNNLYVWDQNDAQITGADVDVLDVENASWTNTTADADGWIIIDTLPYHTVNVYAHYPTAGIYLPNEILGLETGYYGGHNWVLVLYPYVTTPSGFVTLYINTRNYDTKAVLTGVNLQIKNLVTGAITGESTGSTDSVSTVVTNATNYQITGSKSGYLSKTININSGEASSKTVVVELSKATVTTAPTSTIPPGGVTPVVTVDPRTTIQKDADMMNQIRDAGPGLIGLAIVATIFGLIKLMTKK